MTGGTLKPPWGTQGYDLLPAEGHGTWLIELSFTWFSKKGLGSGGFFSEAKSYFNNKLLKKKVIRRCTPTVPRAYSVFPGRPLRQQLTSSRGGPIKHVAVPLWPIVCRGTPSMLAWCISLLWTVPGGSSHVDGDTRDGVAQLRALTGGNQVASFNGALRHARDQCLECVFIHLKTWERHDGSQNQTTVNHTVH